MVGQDGIEFGVGVGDLLGQHLDALGQPAQHPAALKRWNAGTHHYRVERDNLQYYLDEFAFRFNRRRSKARGMLFYRLLQQSVNTDPHPLHELVNQSHDPGPIEDELLEPVPSNTFGEL